MGLGESTVLEASLFEIPGCQQRVTTPMGLLFYLLFLNLFLTVLVSSQGYGFSSSLVWTGCWRIDAFELWYWKRFFRVSWTASRSNQFILKQISPDWKDWCWSWNSNTLATWCKELTHWKRPWCWERLKVKGEKDDRGWDGWMASLTRWTWIWVNSGSWWWTGRPGVLQSMGLQRVRHDWATELNWTELYCVFATAWDFL